MQSNEKEEIQWVILFGPVETSDPIVLLRKLIGQTFWFESNPQRTTGIMSVSEPARLLHNVILVGIIDRFFANMSVERPFYDSYLFYRGKVNQTARIACDYIDEAIQQDVKKHVAKLSFFLTIKCLTIM